MKDVEAFWSRVRAIAAEVRAWPTRKRRFASIAIDGMTPEQKEAQRRSFVYGNTKLANASVTEDLVDEVADGSKVP